MEKLRERQVVRAPSNDDTSIGLFVIVERSYVGLLPRSEPPPLARGQAARFRISIIPDNTI